MPTKEKWARMSEESKEKERVRGRAYYYKHRERRLTAAKQWARDNWDIHVTRVRACARKKYGIDIGGHSKSGECVICGVYQEQLLPDHDHSNLTMRDWICRFCNLKLGQYETREASGLHDKFRKYLARFS